MVKDSVLSLVADLLIWLIGSMEVMSWTSIPEVRVGALESTLPSNNTQTGKLEWHLASKDSEFDAVTVELEST